MGRERNAFLVKICSLGFQAIYGFITPFILMKVSGAVLFNTVMIITTISSYVAVVSITLEWPIFNTLMAHRAAGDGAAYNRALSGAVNLFAIALLVIGLPMVLFLHGVGTVFYADFHDGAYLSPLRIYLLVTFLAMACQFFVQSLISGNHLAAAEMPQLVRLVLYLAGAPAALWAGDPGPWIDAMIAGQIGFIVTLAILHRRLVPDFRYRPTIGADIVRGLGSRSLWSAVIFAATVAGQSLLTFLGGRFLSGDHFAVFNFVFKVVDVTAQVPRRLIEAHQLAIKHSTKAETGDRIATLHHILGLAVQSSAAIFCVLAIVYLILIVPFLAMDQQALRVLLPCLVFYLAWNTPWHIIHLRAMAAERYRDLALAYCVYMALLAGTDVFAVWQWGFVGLVLAKPIVWSLALLPLHLRWFSFPQERYWRDLLRPVTRIGLTALAMEVLVTVLVLAAPTPLPVTIALICLCGIAAIGGVIGKPGLLSWILHRRAAKQG